MIIIVLSVTWLIITMNMVIVILIILIGMSAYSKLCSISHAIGLRSRDGWEPVTVLSSSDKLSLSNCREFSISSCVNSVEKSGHLRLCSTLFILRKDTSSVLCSQRLQLGCMKVDRSALTKNIYLVLVWDPQNEIEFTRNISPWTMNQLEKVYTENTNNETKNNNNHHHYK